MSTARAVPPCFLAVCLAIPCLVPLDLVSYEEPWLETIDEVVCSLNNERIGKRDVERRIDPLIFERIEGFRRRAVAEDRWNRETMRQYHELLMPEFRNALRGVVKEKLMLQEAKERKIEIDEAGVRKRAEQHLQLLRQHSAWIKPDFDGIRATVREQMLLQAFRGALVTALDLPNKPQIEAYYHAHQAKFMRPPMVKLRLIKVSPARKDIAGREPEVRRPHDVAEELRKDVVDVGINFADLAREKSDDDETRVRGGLLLGPEGEPWIDPEQNRLLAPVVRKLGTGSVAERTSKVFEMNPGWAIVFLEERRPGGPSELDSALYEKISDMLMQEVVKRKEKEWFLNALKRSLVLDGSPNPKPIPLSFFFPDETTQ